MSYQDSDPGFELPTKPSSYVLLLSGTHVTGKETLAIALSQWLGCPWLKAEMCHNAATFGARSQAKKGFNYGDVFGRIWLSKLRRIGFLSDRNPSDGEWEVDTPMALKQCNDPRRWSLAPRKLGMECTALISCYAMRKPARDAIRDAMLAQSMKTIWVVMNITKETLSGRTLGAEEPELAKRIMEQKIADIEEPMEDETDIILIDSTRDVDVLLLEIKEGINRQLALF